MDMIVAEEVPYLADGGGQRMPYGSREHRLGIGAHDLIHRPRIRTAVPHGPQGPLAAVARVRCGHEFQDASRGHVLLVDPHAEG